MKSAYKSPSRCRSISFFTGGASSDFGAHAFVFHAVDEEGLDEVHGPLADLHAALSRTADHAAVGHEFVGEGDREDLAVERTDEPALGDGRSEEHTSELQ